MSAIACCGQRHQIPLDLESQAGVSCWKWVLDTEPPSSVSRAHSQSRSHLPSPPFSTHLPLLFLLLFYKAGF